MSQFGGHFPVNGIPYGTYYGVYTTNGQEPMMVTQNSYPVSFSHPQMSQTLRPIPVDHYHGNWPPYQPVMTTTYVPTQSYGQPLHPVQAVSSSIQGSYTYTQNPHPDNSHFGAAQTGGIQTSGQLYGVYPRIGNVELQPAAEANRNPARTTSESTHEPQESIGAQTKLSEAQSPQAVQKLAEPVHAQIEVPQVVFKPVPGPVHAPADATIQRQSTISWMGPRPDAAPRGRNTTHPAYRDINLAKFNADMFEFGPKIGKGKYGDVYLCKDKRTNFIVAIKVLDKMTIRQMRALRQIVREIKHHAYLKHENIIKLYGVFHDEEKIYMIMEYACDGEIYKELKSSPGRKFSEEKASNYIKQVLEAINYLHENDIIHRDIKPENLLKSFGQVKLADFGWSAYAPESKNKRKTFCGTLDYVPPEMVQGEKYDYHIDNWGIGILAFEFVTGQPPFGKKTMRDTLDCIVEGELMIPDTVSKEATDFIKAMLQSNPKLRMELSEALVHPWITKHNA